MKNVIKLLERIKTERNTLTRTTKNTSNVTIVTKSAMKAGNMKNT